MRQLDRKLVRDLWHLRGQVVAVVLVVACGVATYVTMRSAYTALVISQSAYYERFRFADAFAQLKRAPESVAAQVERIPGVAAIQTRIVVEVTLDVAGLEEPAIGRLVSVPETGSPVLNDLYVRQGRYIEPQQHDEVLVSESFAEANHLFPGDTLGAVINGRWRRLRVVGVALSPEYVYEIRGAEVFPDNKRFGVIWMGHDALAAAFNMKGAFNDLAVSLVPGASEPEAIYQVDEILERYGCLGAYGRREQLSHRFLSDEINQDRITGIVVPAIFLGVAAFLIHILLSRLVSTEREQIAVFKAFGYGNFAVGVHYLKLAVVVVLAGTAVGSGVGVWFGSELAQIYSRFFRFPILRFEPGLGLIGMAAIISAVAAVLGAVSAVRRAVALPPAEAMRPEPPARFRAGVIERLGLERAFTLTARMISRNLERRPVKAFMSLLGIAFATAIVVVGLYFFDAVDWIAEHQFRTVQREDVTVTFIEPRTSSARHNLEHLPGVILSEPFRVVPVRLRFEQRSRRTALLGIDPEGQLRSLIDTRMRKIDLPDDGIVVTNTLAEVLAVSPGQMVTVEVLEGARPTRRVRVAALIDEMVGLSAYINRRALNRMMREGETVSGAHLAVDQAQAAQLYSLLKRSPAVSGVSIREVMLASFEKTIAESLTISTTVLTIFACVIAFAMVYNSARIALSERGHELASLRVLGFTRREITVMLLGEQAALTLAAVPLGLALGYGISALLVTLMKSELYRMPLVISGRTYAVAFLTISAAALLS
ncbi:MAG TPA: ABC transporter permease, partial [Blastocatellia bacterium]|nr:ABC transporter permease [Blastocatellia bacterium]